jgi:hypothetical protein
MQECYDNIKTNVSSKLLKLFAIVSSLLNILLYTRKEQGRFALLIYLPIACLRMFHNCLVFCLFRSIDKICYFLSTVQFIEDCDIRFVFVYISLCWFLCIAFPFISWCHPRFSPDHFLANSNFLEWTWLIEWVYIHRS